MFRRENPVEIKLTDPDNPDDNTPITGQLVIGNELIIFKTKSIFKVQLAESTDPDRNHPDTRHTSSKLFSIGTESLLVSRIIIQFSEMTKMVFNQEEGGIFNTHIWNTNQMLLKCEDISFQLYSDTMSLFKPNDEIVTKNKHLGTIPPLRQVLNLETYVNSFLRTAKLFLIDVFRTFNILFEMPIENIDAHFNKHIKWLKSNLPLDTIFTNIDEDFKWIQLMAECRNAMEHPKNGQKIAINNFQLVENNKILPPTWKYDLSKNGLGKSEKRLDLVSDLHTYLNNMLYFFEEVLLLCITEQIKKTGKPLQLFKNSQEQINKECPILYHVHVTQEFYDKNIKKPSPNKNEEG